MKTFTILAVTGGLYLSSLYLNKPLNNNQPKNTISKHCTAKCCKDKCSKSAVENGNNNAEAANPAMGMLLQMASCTFQAIVSWNPLV